MNTNLQLEGLDLLSEDLVRIKKVIRLLPLLGVPIDGVEKLQNIITLMLALIQRMQLDLKT